MNSITQALQFLGQVGGRKKMEGEGETGSPGYHQSFQKKKEQDTPPENSETVPSIEVTDEMVDIAISHFMKAEVSISTGLTAIRFGKGPSLKVMIKDINGSVIRQCTGGEFVRLQDNSAKDARVRGRFLDQKL